MISHGVHLPAAGRLHAPNWTTPRACWPAQLGVSTALLIVRGESPKKAHAMMKEDGTISSQTVHRNAPTNPFQMGSCHVKAKKRPNCFMSMEFLLLQFVTLSVSQGLTSSLDPLQCHVGIWAGGLAVVVSANTRCWWWLVGSWMDKV